MAMYKGKKQKIRGKGHSYYNRYGKRNNTGKAVFFAAMAVLLVALGFILSTPFFKDKDGDTSSVTDDASSMTVSYEDIDETVSEEAVPISSTGNIYVAQYDEYKTDEALNATVSKALNGGFDTVMLNIKDQDGILHYSSGIELALDAEAVNTNDNLEGIIAKIRQAGLNVGVKINVFDEYCIPWHERNAALLANISTKTLWYDFITRDISSGSPWLNPASEIAVNYNLEIVSELCRFDADAIYLEGVHFPVWGKTEVYKLDNSISRQKIIEDFIGQARNITAENGKKLGVIVPLCGAVGDITPHYQNYGFNENVYLTNADEIIIDARADKVFLQDSKYDKLQVDDTAITDLTDAPYDVIYSKVESLYTKSQCTAKVKLWVNEEQSGLLLESEIINKMIKQ